MLFVCYVHYWKYMLQEKRFFSHRLVNICELWFFEKIFWDQYIGRKGEENLCLENERLKLEISWVRTVLSLPEFGLLNSFILQSQCSHLRDKKEKERKQNHTRWINPPSCQYQSFIHLFESWGKKEKNQDDNKNREKMSILKLSLSTLSWHCAETLSGCSVWPCQGVTMIYGATSTIPMFLIPHRKQWQVRLTAV